ncbi:type VII secretion system-associated protein [Streptomyces sp. 21So2-11]|uniref:type VII secretion system-associated protein n=1 Tax=Streptomyces sp. 21So2-11 TaxID=3144408 RepID=UPI00321B8F24
MGKVTVLDIAFLKLFIENHIQDFSVALGKLDVDDVVEGRAISYIADGKFDNTTIDSKKPLAIGPMAGEGEKVGGVALNTIIQKSAAELSRIIEDHTVLFEDLEQALWDTIELLKKDQGKNLDSITTDDFMDIFEDVDSDLGNSGSGEDED